MRKIFNDIRNLDWTAYPINEIDNLFSKFGKFPLMVTDYEPGRIIHRARPVKDGEIVNTVKGLSYKPQENNETYQRASTPKLTMLYGAVIPPEIDSEEIDNGRITSAMETVSFLRNSKLNGEQRLLYGKWVVKSKISLITILFTRYRNSRNKWMRDLSEEFYKNISSYSFEEQKKFKQINNFYSVEFSKHVGVNEDYKYLVSSLFSLKCTQNGYDGLVFPSVRTMGLGINVAIKPSTVDDKMELISVLDCKVFKRNKKVVINNLRFCNVPSGSKEFDLIEITDKNLRFTNDEIEYKLNN